DAATKQAPMAGVPNIRNVIAQLHYVAAILEHEQCCNGVTGLQRSARCQKVCSGQDYGLCGGWGHGRAVAIYMQNRLSLWSAVIRPDQMGRKRRRYQISDTAMGSEEPSAA